MPYRTASKKIWLVKCFLFSGILGIFSIHILLAIYVQTHAYIDTAQSSDVAIVLGTSPNHDGPNPCLVARVDHGIDLLTQGKAANFIFTGGKLEPDVKSEAELMAEVAKAKGIISQAIFVEPKSTSTYENLLFSQKIMKDKHFSTAIIVSDPHQLPRASLIANKLKMSYTVSPAKKSPCSIEWHNLFYYFVYEPIKLEIYKITGKI